MEQETPPSAMLQDPASASDRLSNMSLEPEPLDSESLDSESLEPDFIETDPGCIESAPTQIDSSFFRDGQEERSNDIFIAVMGLTGSGKSSFISHLTKSTVAIGDELQSCTREVNAYRYEYNDSINVYLVDTPGFDDTNISDAEVLREIASWMTGAYKIQAKLSGILYLHRITDTRMTGSARKNLFLFKKLCGPDALKHVILVTTMWEQVEESIGHQRLAELEETEDFWGYMLQQGSRTERHMHTAESARRIIDMFVTKDGPCRPPTMLAIQDEMVNNNKRLSQTEAGKSLDGVLAKEREKFKRELEQTRLEMKEAMEQRDKESQEELLKQQKEAERKIKQLHTQQEELKISMERLHKEKFEAIEARMSRHRQDMQKMEVQTKEKEAQLKKHMEKFDTIEAKMAKQRKEMEKMEIETKKKEARWKQNTEELAVQMVAIEERANSIGQLYAERSISALGRGSAAISLSLRGNRWAFLGPKQHMW